MNIFIYKNYKDYFIRYYFINKIETFYIFMKMQEKP